MTVFQNLGIKPKIPRVKFNNQKLSQKQGQIEFLSKIEFFVKKSKYLSKIQNFLKNRNSQNFSKISQ